MTNQSLWMLGWEGNEHAEAGYMVFSYTFAETKEEATNKFKHAHNQMPYSVDLYWEQDDLDERKEIFEKSGDWIE